ncbi:unnamed protein product [Porites evermanni]|uniref:THAP-type domain-containing protein n=1 Tax=Porites evermanni TaxID=104178 RepID=A0ABN8S596_9CNID|nr:unnamed protein product [Porites evermanni]
MWVPGKTSSLCCKHFAQDDFQRPLNTEVNLKRDFKKDEIGVCVFPSMHPKRKEDDELPSTKRREAQMAQTVQAGNSQDIQINPSTSSQLEEDKSTQTLADQRCSILSYEMELLKVQLSSVRESKFGHATSYELTYFKKMVQV